MLGAAGDAVERYAGLLARLIRLGPRPDSVRSLAPSPPWTAWGHARSGVWPAPDDREADLNSHPETAWLDEIAQRVTRRLRQADEYGTVVGHSDWEAQNLRWRGGQPGPCTTGTVS